MSNWLADQRNNLTRTLILDAAISLLEDGGPGELTTMAVARRANISQRTVFRYFSTREQFLDAAAREARARMDLPEPPRTLEALRVAPRALYTAFERKQRLVTAGLHSELFDLIREGARVRWSAVQKIVDQTAPRKSAQARKIAATNISYYLGATTWHFYRFYFGLPLDETIRAAETSINASLATLGA